MSATIHRFLNINDDWEDTNNWDSGLLPGSGGSGVDTVTIDGPLIGASMSLLQNVNRGVLATGTLTLSGQPGNGETVVIRNRTYTFETAFSDTADYVLIGATASDSIDNLIAAINNAAGEGTTYGTGTVVHADVTAAAGAGDTMDITAKTAGFNGLYVNTSDTLASGSWGDTTMSHDGGSLLAELDIRDKYDGDIGSDGSRLNLSATDFRIRSRAGTVYHALTTGTTNLWLNSDNRVDALVGVGGYTNIFSVSGAADIGASGCTNLYMSYRNNPRTDAVVRFADKTTVITNVWGNGGLIEANCELTNVYSNGQLQIIYGVADNDFVGPDLLVLSGGRFVDNIDTVAGGGVITTCILKGGVLDGSQSHGTKAIGTLIEFPGATILERPESPFAITTHTKVIGG